MALPKNLPYDADTLRSRFDAEGIDAEITEDDGSAVVTTEDADFLTHRDDIHKTMIRSGYRVKDARVGRMLFVPDHENKTGFHG